MLSDRPPRLLRYECFESSDEMIPDFLNSLDLGDTEDEAETVELVRTGKVNDRFEQIVLNNSKNTRRKLDSKDLNEEFFKAAILSSNVNRLRELLAKKKHFLLTSKQKAKVFKLALVVCNHNEEVPVFSSFFRILLKAQFYPQDCIWPSINRLDDTDYPLAHLLNDPRLYEPFLEYDKDFFANENEVNYVAMWVRQLNYARALTALRLGFDPRIEDMMNDRNALDYALDDPFFHLTPDQERDRSELIRTLQDDLYVEPANTIGNLAYFCRIKDWDRAFGLVRRGGMKFGEISPIGLAFYYGNVELVNAAIDMYIDDISIEQLINDLLLSLQSFVRDANQMELLEQAVIRAKTLKNL